MRVGDVLEKFRLLPELDLASVVGRRFAVIAPHPDDESLGCGGIIAEACRQGTPPEVVVVTDGSASHPGSQAYPPMALAELRQEETRQAISCLGLPADKLHFLGVPDGGSPKDAKGLAAIARRLCAVAAGCETLLVTWRHDPHGDHRAAQIAARAAGEVLGARVLEYPVWGWTLCESLWLPEAGWRGWRVPVAAHLGAKRRAIACHASQHGRVVTDAGDRRPLSGNFLDLFDRRWETLVEAV